MCGPSQVEPMVDARPPPPQLRMWDAPGYSITFHTSALPMAGTDSQVRACDCARETPCVGNLWGLVLTLNCCKMECATAGSLQGSDKDSASEY